MSDASAGARPPQDFEKVLSGSDTSVASFDRHVRSPVEKVQHFLHSNPAAVPLIASTSAMPAMIGAGRSLVRVLRGRATVRSPLEPGIPYDKDRHRGGIAHPTFGAGV